MLRCTPSRWGAVALLAAARFIHSPSLSHWRAGVEYEGTSRQLGLLYWWCQDGQVSKFLHSSIRSSAMQTIIRVGVDLAKNVLQVHAVDTQGKVR